MSMNLGLERIEFNHKRNELNLLAKFYSRFKFKVFKIQDLTYEEEDVDLKVVERLTHHVEELEAIEAWIDWPNPELTKKLWSARSKFGSHLNGWLGVDLYRGFSLKGSQNTMGLSDRPRVGDRFELQQSVPLSFSHVRGIAEDFGTIVVRLKGNKYRHRALPLTPDILEAVDKLAKWDGFEKSKRKCLEAETIILPAKEPLELEVVHVGK